MPIYDYECQECENKYSALVPSYETPDENVECPACKEHKSERHLSMRAAFIGSTKETAPPRYTGGCAGGACGLA